MIIPNTMHGKNIAVLGLGRSGLATAHALIMSGARVYAYDDFTTPTLPRGVDHSHYHDWPWGELTAMVISPGIPHQFPKPHPAAALADTHGVPIISDIELLMHAKPTAKIIGITGTNGKSTTVMLIQHLLEASGIKAVVGGNIGMPVLGLDDPGAGGVIILELSSYQLETTPALALDAGAIINITPDHLDRHGGWEGYLKAKTRLAEAIAPDGLLVFGDGATLRAMAEQCQGRSVIITEGDAPSTTNRHLTGPHNRENMAVALRLCKWLCEFLGGCDEAAMPHALGSFTGLPHRMEWLGTHHGIAFINDSKATNAVAAEKALMSFPSIYWIAGGEGKDGGITSLRHSLGAVVRAYLIGDSAEAFSQSLRGIIPQRICKTLDVAVSVAIADALHEKKPNPTILLAPAAASFDQFANFAERGEAFRTLVQNWIQANPKQAEADYA